MDIKDATETHDALEYEIRMPYVGAWHGEVQSSGDKPLSGAVTLTDGDQVFIGYALRSQVEVGRIKTKVVGGPGRSTNGAQSAFGVKLAAKNYSSGVTARTILSGILSGIGASLSSAVPDDEATIGRFLNRWQRTNSTAGREITAVLQRVGAIWRVLDDGTVWVGAESYPTADIEAEVLDQNMIEGAFELAPEKPNLRPGVTFQSTQIKYVVHTAGPAGLRTTARLEPPSKALDGFLESVRREIALASMFGATVSKQNANGTLAVKPDDPAIAGSGLDNVKLVMSAPGRKVVVAKGTRVRVFFDDRDPGKQRAACFDHDNSAAEAIVLGTTLNTYLKTHTHGSPLGPTSAPVAYPADSLVLSTREAIAGN